MFSNYLELNQNSISALAHHGEQREALLSLSGSSYDDGVRKGHHTPPRSLARDAKPPLGAASARLGGR